MYKVKVNGISLSFGEDYKARTLEEVLAMVLKLSEGIIIKELIVTKE